MKHKILIVEDEPELLHMLGLRAQFYNYSCVLEQVGDQCVEKALLHQPDVILLDLNLPRISGLGLIRELKKNPKLAKIPIVVFSALHQTEIVREALDIGANAYYTKSGNMKELFKLIGEYVQEYVESEKDKDTTHQPSA
jgi:DNA-binding response OmpR family regulator